LLFRKLALVILVKRGMLIRQRARIVILMSFPKTAISIRARRIPGKAI